MEQQIAKNIVETVKKHEGFEPRVYKCPTGHDTIGYGFKVDNLCLDQDIAEEILIRILAKKEEQMRNTFDWIDDMPILIQEVVLNMCFQMGVNGVSKFRKMIKAMKLGSRIMITGYNQKGSQTIDHYSLMGFSKAYNAAKKSCT